MPGVAHSIATQVRTLKFLMNHPLNRDQRLQSILRYAKWQIGSRLVPGPTVYHWINGSKFIVRNGQMGLTGNIYAGLQEFPDMGFLLHFLRAEDLFVDVGAFAGSYTILACAVVGDRGIAFEPIPESYEQLVENMRLNFLDDKVECINQAVGAQDGNLVFTSNDDRNKEKNHALAPGEKCNNSVTVEVTTLDTALRKVFPSLIKIDVEGFEIRVLGGGDTLKNQHFEFVELNVIDVNGGRVSKHGAAPRT